MKAACQIHLDIGKLHFSDASNKVTSQFLKHEGFSGARSYPNELCARRMKLLILGLIGQE
jgi:hypothetical protein